METLIWGKLGTRIFRRAHTRVGLRSIAYDKFTPFNPRTERQQSWRKIFSLGIRNWQSLSKEEKERYREATKGLPLLGHNLFLKFFLETKLKQGDLFVLAHWQKELEKMALNWAVARRLELELSRSSPEKIQKTR